MSDGAEHSRLPWVLAALVLVVGGAKLDALRPLLGQTLALAAPVVPVALAVKRVEGGGQRLERTAAIVGWIALLAGEAAVAGGFFHVQALAALAAVWRVLLYGAGAGALFVHTLEERAIGRARFAGYLGISLAFTLWLSRHAGSDGFASVGGAFFVGLFVGGGGGLLCGELLGRTFGRRNAA